MRILVQLVAAAVIAGTLLGVFAAMVFIAAQAGP